MAMTSAGTRGGGHVASKFDKRSGIKDGDIETFITKVDAVNAAIQGMKDGDIDPANVHVEGVPTLEEEHQMAAEKRRKRLDLARRERENLERLKRDEQEKWWRGAELLYGERVWLSVADAGRETNACARTEERMSLSSRKLSEEEKTRLKDRYSLEYSRWDSWTPSDPATLAEVEEREAIEDDKRSKEFEESNPDFCKQMTDDMKTRSEASEKTDFQATAARLKGNRFYKAKRWDEALGHYMTSLRARPYIANTLGNVAQVLIRLERLPEAVEFCDRALHVDRKFVKALSRRASAFVLLARRSCRLKKRWIAAANESGERGEEHTLVSFPDACTAEDGGVRVENDGGGRASGDEIGGRKIEDTFCKRYGGKNALLALALADLNTAVAIEAGVEDVRRQRDTLAKEIEEEQAEAEVMQKVRTDKTEHTLCGVEAPGQKDMFQDAWGAADAEGTQRGVHELSLELKGEQKHFTGVVAETVARTPVLRQDTLAAAVEGDPHGKTQRSNADLDELDRILEEALSEGVTTNEVIVNHEEDDGTSRPACLLLRLTALLKEKPTARVYFRASGGLAQLAEATATVISSIVGPCDFSDAKPSITSPAPSKTPGSPRARNIANERSSSNTSCENCSVGAHDISMTSHGAIATDKRGWQRADLMLRAVAAALEGGERLAQQDVLKSGLLDGPCAWLLQNARHEHRIVGGPITVAEGVRATGAAVLVLCRVVDDVTVRTHMARNPPLVSGLIDVIGAVTTPPSDVEAAAVTLRALLLGRTAATASKTIRKLEKTMLSTQANEASGAGVCKVATVVSGTLLAWKEGSSIMQGAPASIGAALCGVLANLAIEEDFRESFAVNATSSSKGGKDHGQPSPARTLVLVAGDNKVDRLEARSSALTALINACLHNERVQATTVSAGGLALVVATLSLDAHERQRTITPLLAARSAALLARLSSLPAAGGVLARRGVIERIINATVRSSALGGDLYTANDATQVGHEGVRPDDDVDGARATERENLVRTLASILRFTFAGCRIQRHDKVGPSAPSSNVYGPAEDQAQEVVTSAAMALGLVPALVSFLPPSRENGVEGVTTYSVAQRPEWSAPPAATANACGCLLHLLGSQQFPEIAEQVVDAGGIPRIICLFANSGGEGPARSARTNAAICLAKLARDPEYKKMIASLRGMEMLLQAGSGLV